jgi:glyoxylase-like metal-dependent hydrolase (beta-lactamase superfamily II)
MKKGLCAGLFLGLMAASVFASESDGIFSWKVGRFEVYMLVEGERQGNTGILVGADAALLGRYIPAGGFVQSTNAFLIKTPQMTVMVDTGTGSGGVLLEKMRKLGTDTGQVDAVLLTHMHGDHIGSLQKGGTAVFPRAKIYLSAREREYWTRTQANQGAVAALAPYGPRVETFEPAQLGSALREILPGISPIAAYGHTPGHTAFLVEDGGSRLIIWGDLLHVALVQFPVPEISATYDMDQKAAAAIRRQMMDYAAKNGIPVAGMHMAYPGVGTVQQDGEGFRFEPAK